MTDLAGWQAFGLLAVCVIVILVTVGWWVINKLAEQGDKRAQDLQRQIETVRDMIPIDKVRGLVEDAQRAAKNTATPLDDLVTDIAADLLKPPPTITPLPNAKVTPNPNSTDTITISGENINFAPINIPK